MDVNTQYQDDRRLADHLDIFTDVFCDRLKLLCLSPKALQRLGAGSLMTG